MLKEEALRLIVSHKNKLIDPVEMLHWTALTVIISKMGDMCWDEAVEKAYEVMSR